ncbi:MAG: helix-turn-helix domain-containing protein, partial [Actinomycetota bacterium]
MAPPSTVGPLLKEWRGRRGRSQLDLAVEAGVSTRHLSFVETGRSRPSPELVLVLAEHLDVPLRERNSLLVAAGHAPRFGERALDDPAAEAALAAVERLLAAHDPYPGVAVDRRWDVVRANDAALTLTTLVSPAAMEPGLNVYRLSLHPEGLIARSPN